MPKSTLNARPCLCCGRLMARKRGKRTTCGVMCMKALPRPAKARAHARTRQQARPTRSCA